MKKCIVKLNKMENIPTAEELLNDRVYITQDDIEDVHDSISTVAEAMIEFAKLHVEAALKHASEKAELSNKPKFSGDYNLVVDEDSILNSYPLNKIK